MKGIILAGGTGSRLYPATLAVNKQLMPVYDKPMVYYPLSTLMLAGIRDILIITTPHDHDEYVRLLGDGHRWGINLSYVVQEKPNGIAYAFILGEKFIGNDTVSLILGDNIFYGDGLVKHLYNSVERATNYNMATIYGYYVNDPKRFGIVEFDLKNNVLSIEEKPENPKSNYAVTGLYFYPKGVSKKAREVKPSKRGELEITDLNNMYLQENNLHVTLLGRGYAWLDTGTQESLIDASNFVKTIEEHQGLKICCPEEIAYKRGWINRETLLKIGQTMSKNEYGKHLINVASGKIKY